MTTDAVLGAHCSTFVANHLCNWVSCAHCTTLICWRDSNFESLQQMLCRPNEHATQVLLSCGPAYVARLMQYKSNKYTVRNKSLALYAWHNPARQSCRGQVCQSLARSNKYFPVSTMNPFLGMSSKTSLCR